ncbi:alcohol dehydrogenase [Bordetella genomosp. 8]|uniref:Alcohol dehydrogenase n=1 Tax=Bordetella genomosp. 8 TaxID=1416806 RepID=A0A1W6YGL1_9BORD|nr:c-type cytochrome [Bordetella genomosp. 8]ARP79663.1 alcohol dehydrogenase [Bordetella genomosp. 8]
MTTPQPDPVRAGDGHAKRTSSHRGARAGARAGARIAAALLLLAAVGVAALAWRGYREDASTGPTHAIADPAQRVAYGAYLARVGDCMACHTVPGGQPYAGGAAIPTAFGTFYGPNITPDATHGIGNWSADDFWRALHQGKSPSGSLLYPAFPYTEYTRVNRADADAIYAYLRTVAPAARPSRPHELDFPYGWRPVLALWRGLYFRPGVHADADAGAAVGATASSGSTITNASTGTGTDTGAPGAVLARGRYLVDGLGHCIACHAPRNALGATPGKAGLSGGVIEGLGWYAPPLDGDPDHGMGRWSENDIAALLQTGTSPHGTASGPMGEVVSGSTQFLTDPDARAIAAYLKSLPAAPASTQASVREATNLRRGGALYEQHCVQCHAADGRGKGSAWPALAGNISVTAPYPGNVIHMVLEGGFAPATRGNSQPHGMPPFGQTLSDDDVAAVVTYVRNSWGNAAGGVSSLQVKQARAAGG